MLATLLLYSVLIIEATSQFVVNDTVVNTTDTLFATCLKPKDNITIPLLFPISAVNISVNLTFNGEETNLICDNATNQTSIICPFNSSTLKSGIYSLDSINSTFINTTSPFIKQTARLPLIKIGQNITDFSFTSPYRETQIVNYDNVNTSNISFTTTPPSSVEKLLFKYNNTVTGKEYFVYCKSNETNASCAHTPISLPPGEYKVLLPDGCGNNSNDKEAFVTVKTQIEYRRTSVNLTVNPSESTINFSLTLSTPVTRCHGDLANQTGSLTGYSCLRNPTPNETILCNSYQLGRGEYYLKQMLCDGSEIGNFESLNTPTSFIQVTRTTSIEKQDKILSLAFNKTSKTYSGSNLNITFEAAVTSVPTVYADVIEAGKALNQTLNLTPYCTISPTSNLNVTCNLSSSPLPSRPQLYPIYIQLSNGTIENTGILLYTMKRSFAVEVSTSKSLILTPFLLLLSLFIL